MRRASFSTKQALTFTGVLVVALLTVYGLDRWLFPHHRLVYNETDSLKGYLFIVDVNQPPQCGPDAGDYIQIQMPVDAKYYAGKRLLKKAKGCPGDQITVQDRYVYIEQWFAGQAVPTLEDGTIMPMVDEGVVPADHYYVWASHPQSFDSRYQAFGFVHKDQVIGRARRVF